MGGKTGSIRLAKNIAPFGYVRHADGITDDYLNSGVYELVVAQEKIPATLHLEPPYGTSGGRVRA